MRPTIPPIPPRISQYGVDPALVKAGMGVPGMTSVPLSDLFPDLPAVIYPGPAGIPRETADRALGVDMERIKPGTP